MLVHEKKCKQLITVRELVGVCARLLAPPRPLVTTCTAPTTSSSHLVVPFSQLDPNAHDNIPKFVLMPQAFVEIVGTYIHTRTYSHAQAQAHTHTNTNTTYATLARVSMKNAPLVFIVNRTGNDDCSTAVFSP